MGSLRLGVWDLKSASAASDKQKGGPAKRSKSSFFTRTWSLVRAKRKRSRCHATNSKIWKMRRKSSRRRSSTLSVGVFAHCSHEESVD